MMKPLLNMQMEEAISQSIRNFKSSRKVKVIGIEKLLQNFL